MTVSVSQKSFVGGEWAPSLHARTDLAKYTTAVRLMQNFYPHPHGPASNRGGTQYVCETKYSSKESRVVKFQFSVIQSYILEFGDQYMRVIKDGGQVLRTGVSDTTTDIVESGTYQWTASGSGTAEYYLEADGGGDPSLSEPFRVLENSSELTEGTLGSLAVSEWGWGDNDSLGHNTVYVRLSDGTDPDSKADGYVVANYIVDIDTPYDEDDLARLKFTQSADVLYITHPTYAPRKLTRTAHDTWTLSTITFGPDISAPTGLANGGSGVSYKVTAVSEDGEESIASSAVDGAASQQTTWSAVTGAEYYNVYKDGNGSGTYGWIGQADSAQFTEPTATIEPDYTTTPPSTKNPFSGAGDYPGVCTFFEQRLVFGRTNNNPQKLWGSVVGSFENMNKSSPLRDDDSYSFTINARQVNEIRFMVPMNELIIGTSGSEWKMGGGNSSDAVTPTSVNMRMQSQWGVSHVQPLVIGNTVLFIEGSGEVVRDLLYSLEVDGYTGNDLSILANHLFRGYTLTDWGVSSWRSAAAEVIAPFQQTSSLSPILHGRDHPIHSQPSFGKRP